MIRKTRQGSVCVKSKCSARSRAYSCCLITSCEGGSLGLISGCAGRLNNRSSSVVERCPLLCRYRNGLPLFLRPLPLFLFNGFFLSELKSRLILFIPLLQFIGLSFQYDSCQRWQR